MSIISDEKDLIRKYLQGGRLPLHVADALVRAGHYDALSLVPFVSNIKWVERVGAPMPNTLPRLPEIECWDATLQLKHNNITVLVDSGHRYTRSSAIPDAVIITHAHHDHIGNLAKICNEFPNVPVIMTPETATLLAALEGDEQANLRTLLAKHLLPLPATGDIQKLPGLEVRFLPAGHLWGAAMVDLTIDGTRVLITGDVCGRDVGGLPGFSLPTATYDAVFMEGTHAHDTDLPTADANYNRASLLAQITQHVQEGQKHLLISTRALGETQEVYAAIVRAMRSGELRGWNVQMSGAAFQVSQLYAQNLSAEPYGVWALPPTVCNPHRVPPRTIVIASGTLPENGTAAQSQWALWHDDPNATIMTSHNGWNGGASYTPRHSAYRVFTHASLGELAYLGLGTNCGTIYLYHGRGLGSSPLAEWLRGGGKTVRQLE